MRGVPISSRIWLSWNPHPSDDINPFHADTFSRQARPRCNHARSPHTISIPAMPLPVPQLKAADTRLSALPVMRPVLGRRNGEKCARSAERRAPDTRPCPCCDRVQENVPELAFGGIGPLQPSGSFCVVKPPSSRRCRSSLPARDLSSTADYRQQVVPAGLPPPPDSVPRP